jgi:peptidoglycan hydrolase-like protein with peptidoglycan-binding domain
VIVGAIVLVGFSVRGTDDAPSADLGPSEAQQNRADQHAVERSRPTDELTEAQILNLQEQLEKAGYTTAGEKGAITPETEAALRAYQRDYGLAVTGTFDEETQRSLMAARTPTPGRPTDGKSVPGGTAPYGSPR